MLDDFPVAQSHFFKMTVGSLRYYPTKKLTPKGQLFISDFRRYHPLLHHEYNVYEIVELKIISPMLFSNQ
nr:unnamed protein product [uncultured bacterium]